jgi:hypothetical protein
MHGAAHAELDLAPNEVFENLAGVRQRPRQTIERRDPQRVTAAAPPRAPPAGGDQLGQAKADNVDGEVHVALLYDRISQVA